MREETALRGRHYVFVVGHVGGEGPPIALRLGCLQCSGNGSVVGDWWGRDGVLARGGWLLPVGWTVNTGFYLFLETAFQWSFSLTDGSGV